MNSAVIPAITTIIGMTVPAATISLSPLSLRSVATAKVVIVTAPAVRRSMISVGILSSTLSVIIFSPSPVVRSFPSLNVRTKASST